MQTCFGTAKAPRKGRRTAHATAIEGGSGRSRSQDLRRILCAPATASHGAIRGRVGHRLHALPHGGHDHHHLGAALLRQLFPGRSSDRHPGRSPGPGKPHAGQAGRQVRPTTGLHSHGFGLGRRSHGLDYIHHLPRPHLGALSGHPFHGGHSAMGSHEPQPVDAPATRRPPSHQPGPVLIRGLRRGHVGDRQPIGLHPGGHFGRAGLLLHWYLRADRGLYVSLLSRNRAALADGHGPRPRHHPQGVPGSGRLSKWLVCGPKKAETAAAGPSGAPA